MIIRRFFSLSLAVAGCAAAAYAIGRHTRHLEKRQLKEGLRTREDEGGNLAPSEAGAGARVPRQPPESRLDYLNPIFPTAAV